MNNENLKKLISDKPSNWREKLIQRKQEHKDRIEKSLPPKEIRQWMRDKTKETSKMNKGQLDEQSFMLGLMCMWSYLYNKKMISDQNDERSVATVD